MKIPMPISTRKISGGLVAVRQHKTSIYLDNPTAIIIPKITPVAYSGLRLPLVFSVCVTTQTNPVRKMAVVGNQKSRFRNELLG